MKRLLTAPLLNSLPYFGLLLFALLPICEEKEWLWYTAAMGGIALFAIFLIAFLASCKKQGSKVAFFSFLGYIHLNLFGIGVGITGIITNIVQDSNEIYFWCMVLFIETISLLFPLHIKGTPDC